MTLRQLAARCTLHLAALLLPPGCDVMYPSQSYMSPPSALRPSTPPLCVSLLLQRARTAPRHCSLHQSCHLPQRCSLLSATAMREPTAALFLTRAMLDTSDLPPVLERMLSSRKGVTCGSGSRACDARLHMGCQPDVCSRQTRPGTRDHAAISQAGLHRMCELSRAT